MLTNERTRWNFGIKKRNEQKWANFRINTKLFNRNKLNSKTWYNKRISNKNGWLDDRSVLIIPVHSENILSFNQALWPISFEKVSNWGYSLEQRCALYWSCFHVFSVKVWRYLPSSFQSCLTENSSWGYFSLRVDLNSNRFSQIFRFLNWFHHSLWFLLNILWEN